MAAYGALVSLMNDLELIPNHPTHSFSFENKQITSLSQTVHFLIDFMETCNSHGCTREAAEVLESRIASAAHAAHCVIESHVVDQIHAGSTRGGKPRSYFLLDLQKAIDNMDFIKRKAMQFKAKSGLKVEQPTYSAPTSSQPLTSGKNVMVGFDAVVVRLMEMLTGEPSNQQVIPVVGMGGLGKTTLTRNVYEHLLIQHHFDVRLWATISQEYSTQTILTELLFGERKSTNGETVNRLGEQLHKMLWGRRYLIVLDDMWSVEAWNEVQMFLPDNGNGSCVIVTSRLSNLAAYLSSSPFEMNFLDEDKSWELFCGKAFGEEDCPVELEEVGKKIVKRCRGLPLSIIVIGGHLKRSTRVIEYWEKVANLMNPIWSSSEDDQCLNIISLSYEHLSVYLKPCFLYMGIFKENLFIHVPELIQLWIAEGFLKPTKGLSLEEVAENHLQDLIDRNLILVRERSWNGKVHTCGIHDIVRELCLKVGKKETFMCVIEDTTQGIDIGRERRVVIPEGKKPNSDTIGALESASQVRSIIRGQRGQFNFDELRMLRVSLDSDFIFDGRWFPAAHLNLRYHAFYVESALLYIIPWSISLFWNMQALTLMNHSGIFVPSEIWEMTQLRHLEFFRVRLPDPERSNQEEGVVLRNLHTLLGVLDLRLTEEVCKRMPNIKKLTVSYDRFHGDCETASYYYCLHNLGRFNKLESLSLIREVISDYKWSDIAPSFGFPSSVKELCLWNCNLDWEDLTMMINSLPHLGSLGFSEVKGPEWELVDEEFPHLKTLTICRCHDLIYWNASSSHFPVLESLQIFTLPKLSEIPFDIGEIPALKYIELDDCSLSAAVSAMRIVVEQEDLGNQDVQLDVGFLTMEQVERFQEMVQEEDLKSSNLRLSYQFKKIKVF